MPVLDGYAATKAIRAWERAQGRNPVPILALTANALQGEVQRSLEAGCTAHLTKPIRKARLMEAIQLYYQTTASAAPSAPGVSSAPVVLRISGELEPLMPGFWSIDARICCRLRRPSVGKIMRWFVKLVMG